MHQSRPLAWCSATPIEPARPCRTNLILLPSCVSRPAALMGFRPFAGLLPQASGRAFLPDRAHMSFVASRPPRLIFVGVIGRCLDHLWREIGRRSIADFVVGVALDFWASLPSAIRIPNNRAGDRSCLGLCLLQGCRARCCAFDRARPRSDHQPPPAHARNFVRPHTDYPLAGFRNTRRLKRGAEVRPFSVLMGLMPS